MTVKLNTKRIASRIINKLRPRETRGVLTSLNKDSSGRVMSASVILEGGATAEVTGVVALGVSLGASVALSVVGGAASPQYTITRVLKSGFGVGSSDPNGFLSTPSLVLINGDFPLTVYTHPVTVEKSLTIDFPVRMIPEQKNQGIKTAYQIEVIDANTRQLLGSSTGQMATRVMGSVNTLEESQILIEPVSFMGEEQSISFPSKWGVIQIGDEVILYETLVEPIQQRQRQSDGGDEDLRPGPDISLNPQTLDCHITWPIVINAEYYEVKVFNEKPELSARVVSAASTLSDEDEETMLLTLPSGDFLEFEVMATEDSPLIASGIRRQFWGTPKSNADDTVITLLTDTISIANLPGNHELEVRARATAYDGRVSNWSEYIPFTSSYDVTPPPKPSDVIQISYSEHIYLDISTEKEIKWGDVDALDLAHYEVQRSSDGVVWDLDSMRRVLTTSVSLNDQEPQSAYRVRSVDRSGNRSQWSHPTEFVRKSKPRWFYV